MLRSKREQQLPGAAWQEVQGAITPLDKYLGSLQLFILEKSYKHPCTFGECILKYLFWESTQERKSQSGANADSTLQTPVSQSGCTIFPSHQQESQLLHMGSFDILACFDSTTCEVVPYCSFNLRIFDDFFFLALLDLSSPTRNGSWALGSESTES